MYTSLIPFINETAETILPKRKKASLQSLITSNPDYIAAGRARDAALKLNHSRNTRSSSKRLRDATVKVREVETRIQEEYVNKTIDSIHTNFQSKSNSSGVA